MLYKYKGECEKSILNFKKAIAINTLNKNYKLVGRNYGNIARCYSKINQTDSAYYYFDKGIYYAKRHGTEEILQGIYGKKAYLLSEHKRYKEALPLQLNYLAYAKSIRKNLSIIVTNTNLARTYFGLKEHKKALFHTKEAIDLATKIKMTNRLDITYKIRSDIYKSMGKYDLAFDDLQKHNEIQNEINIVKNAKKFTELEMAYSFEKERIKDSIIHIEEKKRIELHAESQKIKKQLYIAILVIITIVSITILYYGYRLYSTTQKKNKIREAQLSEKISNLNTEVTTKKEEVNDLLTETLVHLRTKEKLANNLAKLSHNEEGETLKGIIADLKAEKLGDSKIIVLKKNIETLNYEFLKTLKTQHPTLTKTDIEICSFIKIGLSRAEVANLRKTSLYAIKSTRYRLKKKLNLTSNDSLDQYIKSL